MVVLRQYLKQNMLIQIKDYGNRNFNYGLLKEQTSMNVQDHTQSLIIYGIMTGKLSLIQIKEKPGINIKKNKKNKNIDISSQTNLYRGRSVQEAQILHDFYECA